MLSCVDSYPARWRREVRRDPFRIRPENNCSGLEIGGELGEPSCMNPSALEADVDLPTGLVRLTSPGEVLSKRYERREMTAAVSGRMRSTGAGTTLIRPALV